MDHDLNAQNLILKHLNDPENEVLTKQVNTFRLQSAENENYFQEISSIWYAAEKTKPLQYVDFNTSVKSFKDKLVDHVQETPRRSIGRIFRVAAAAVLVSAIAFWFYSNERAVEYLVKNTENQIDSLILSDGTKILLAKHTTISYPAAFKGKFREVSLLHGQAFFKVNRDVKHPFGVTIGQSKVTVLGTSFNIHFTNDFINLSVATGKVMFSPNQVSQSSVLTAGQALQYNLIKNQLKFTDAVNADAWLTKELVFIDMPLERVCEQLSNYYGVKIVMAAQGIQAKMFNAKFKDSSLDDVLTVLKRTYKIKIEKSNDLITITN